VEQVFTVAATYWRQRSALDWKNQSSKVENQDVMLRVYILNGRECKIL